MKVGRPRNDATEFFYNQKEKTFFCQKCGKVRHRGKIINVNGDKFRVCIICEFRYQHGKLIFIKLND